MALLNNIHIFVQDESISREIEGTVHPVEKGLDITDHVRKQPSVLQLKGVLAADEDGGMSAADKLSKLVSLQSRGSIISYKGRNVFGNGQIISLSTAHPNTIWGGCSFEMEIREIRVAKSSYNPNTKTSVQVEKNSGEQERFHTVKKGDCRWNIAQTYKANGVSVESLTTLNTNRTEIFASGKRGDWISLKVGTKVLLGEW